jgi:hypothetical protein
MSFYWYRAAPLAPGTGSPFCSFQGTLITSGDVASAFSSMAIGFHSACLCKASTAASKATHSLLLRIGQVQATQGCGARWPGRHVAGRPRSRHCGAEPGPESRRRLVLWLDRSLVLHLRRVSELSSPSSAWMSLFTNSALALVPLLVPTSRARLQPRALRHHLRLALPPRPDRGRRPGQPLLVGCDPPRRPPHAAVPSHERHHRAAHCQPALGCNERA